MATYICYHQTIYPIPYKQANSPYYPPHETLPSTPQNHGQQPVQIPGGLLEQHRNRPHQVPPPRPTHDGRRPNSPVSGLSLVAVPNDEATVIRVGGVSLMRVWAYGRVCCRSVAFASRFCLLQISTGKDQDQIRSHENKHERENEHEHPGENSQLARSYGT